LGGFGLIATAPVPRPTATHQPIQFRLNLGDASQLRLKIPRELSGLFD
jgi:hypothetical protein